MPERFETVQQYADELKRWSQSLLDELAEATATDIRTVEFGERHGSWFLQVRWSDGDLSKSADVALTNPTSIPDSTAAVARLTVWASASNEVRFVRETLVDSRRTLRRLSTDSLRTYLLSAIQRADNYNVSSLTEAYVTGVETAPR